MAKSKSPKSAVTTTPRAAKKLDQAIALLRREGGANITDLTGATGWLPHSTRAVLTGLRKKGFALEKTNIEGVTRYTITAEPKA